MLGHEQLAVLNRPEDSACSELRNRARVSSKTDCTKHYIYSSDGEEKAFVSLDHREDLNSIVLYEIFVPKILRGQGIGRHALSCVEHFAASRNYDSIVLVPEPLDHDVDKQRLIQWYRRSGYVDRPDSRVELTKRLKKNPK